MGRPRLQPKPNPQVRGLKPKVMDREKEYYCTCPKCRKYQSIGVFHSYLDFKCTKCKATLMPKEFAQMFGAGGWRISTGKTQLNLDESNHFCSEFDGMLKTMKEGGVIEDFLLTDLNLETGIMEIKFTPKKPTKKVAININITIDPDK